MKTSVAETKQYLWCLQRSGQTTQSERCSQRADITITEPKKDNPDRVRKSSSHSTIAAMISFTNYPVEIQHDMAYWSVWQCTVSTQAKLVTQARSASHGEERSK